MKTTNEFTKGEIETLKFLNECDGEDSSFEIPEMTNSLKGFCGSLEKKGLVNMFNGECYFDGMITEKGYEVLKTLSNTDEA